MTDVDTLAALPAYEWDRARKRAFLLDELGALTRRHRRDCPEYGRILDALGFEEAASLEEFAVECGPIRCFYPAEEEHQRYLEKHPRGYCHISLRKMAALPRCSLPSYDRPAKTILRAFMDAEEQRES